MVYIIGYESAQNHKLHANKAVNNSFKCKLITYIKHKFFDSLNLITKLTTIVADAMKFILKPNSFITMTYKCSHMPFDSMKMNCGEK